MEKQAHRGAREALSVGQVSIHLIQSGEKNEQLVLGQAITGIGQRMGCSRSSNEMLL